MNGIHDLGGMHGMGPVVCEPDEPVFHADWERRAFALLNLMGIGAGIEVDEMRHTIERMPPAEYLTTSYYEHWLHAAETLAAEKGIAGRPDKGAALPADQVDAVVAGGASSRREVADPPRFRPGDRVTARTINPVGHTRLPRYVRGRMGTIEAQRGGFAFADTRARGLGDQPQHVYLVRFTARELWGEAASAGDALYLDLWESYLEPAA